ncbi:universal stress protein [Actinoplanes sp. NPDC051343]|uniref:universal stress protein n=1 Tax=Actinoplanes sp. NPDC051343 TaxID=3363906 RepID=UPI0037B9B7BB
MTGPVIVGVDGGPTGPDAVVLGCWLATALGTSLTVTAVHAAPAALGSGRVDAEWVADRHRAATRVLDETRASLVGVACAIDYRTIASSSAAHGLSDLAEQLSAAYIVVGSGRNAPRERLFAGSTAERLMAGSICPIAVAPTGLKAPLGALDRIGVAYVDTPDGRAALTAAAELARHSGAHLRLTTVVAAGDAALPFLLGDDTERAFLDTARETYERSLSRAAADVPDVTAEWEIRPGDPVDTLADLDDVDVLFCGSRGYGPARRVVLGGVSARLSRRARRPLIVVPRSG